MTLKIALGMIVRDFVSERTLMDFVKNAEKHGRHIDRVIIAYSHALYPPALFALEERVKVSLIELNNYSRAHGEFRRLGVDDRAADTLLHSSLLSEHGLTPYGFNRNHVLMEAMFEGIELLIFVDSDVMPRVLRRTDDGRLHLDEVDFIGSHLSAVQRGADVTTSDYSGYNILPPVRFRGMDELLYGLHKEDMTHFWENSRLHGCLAVQSAAAPRSKRTKKLLGGNLGIRMEALPGLPPFFSPHFFSDGKPYLARGEDTFMGLTAGQGHLNCMDIDVHIFHDTYGSFPERPDLVRDARVRERLFYACTGWIGRNVFLRWSSGRTLTEGETRLRALEGGVRGLYAHTRDERFLELPRIARDAEDGLTDMVDGYFKSVSAWNNFTERWYGT